MNRFCYNGEYVEEDEVHRYQRSQEGVMETMLVHEGQILRRQRHIQRVANALDMLKVKNDINSIFTIDIQNFIRNNNWISFRLKVQIFPTAIKSFRGMVNVLIAAYPLTSSLLNGLGEPCRTVMYGGHLKPFGAMQNAKLNERTVYSLAQEFALSEGADEAIVLNEAGRPIESTISNIWWRRDDTWFTPPLSEGPVAGTVRAELLELSPFKIIEAAATVDKLMASEEIMLTNAIRGVRPVVELQGKRFPVVSAPDIAAWLQDRR